MSRASKILGMLNEYANYIGARMSDVPRLRGDLLGVPPAVVGGEPSFQNKAERAFGCDDNDPEKADDGNHLYPLQFIKLKKEKV